MAKKKSSIEAVIVEFFTTADPAAKQTLFNVIQGLMKNTTVSAAPAPAKTTTRAPRTKTTNLPAASSAVDTVDQQAA